MRNTALLTNGTMRAPLVMSRFWAEKIVRFRETRDSLTLCCPKLKKYKIEGKNVYNIDTRNFVYKGCLIFAN